MKLGVPLGPSSLPVLNPIVEKLRCIPKAIEACTARTATFVRDVTRGLPGHPSMTHPHPQRGRASSTVSLPNREPPGLHTHLSSPLLRLPLEHMSCPRPGAA